MASVEGAVGNQNQDEGNGEASSLQQRHAAMLHRLAIKEDARMQKLASRRAGSLASVNPNESADRFLEAFSESFKQLEQNLSSLQSRGFSQDMKSELDLAALRISELEQFVAKNSYFLPAYEVRASQSSIANLRGKLEAVNLELFPRKRFSFKSKAGRDLKLSEEVAVKASQAAGTLDFTAVEAVQDLEGKSSDTEMSKASGDVVVEKAKHNQVSEDASKFTSEASACAICDLEGGVVVKDLKNQEDSEFVLENLVNCRVYVRGICRAMYAHNLKHCKVFVGPVTGSVLIENVENCTFMLASHQIRIHHAKKTDMYLRVRSRPIVEYTSGIRFAPYAFSYQGIGDDLLAASLYEETGLWKHVDDFRWLRAIPSPNWSILPEKEQAQLEDGSAVLPWKT